MNRKKNHGGFAVCECMKIQPSGQICSCTKEINYPPGNPIPDQPVCCDCQQGKHQD